MIWWNWYDVRFWYLLLDPLVGSSSIEVLDRGAQHSVKLLLIEAEHMIEALAPHTQEKAFTDSVRSRCLIRCCEHLDPTRVRNPCEAHPKLAIVIPKKVFRPLSPRRGFPKLLCGPSISGISCDADMDHSARLQFDHEEGEKRTEEEVSDWEKVAGPDLCGMIAQENPPVLTPRSSRTHLPHVLLDRSFADMQSQLEEFTPNPFRSEDGDSAPPFP